PGAVTDATTTHRLGDGLLSAGAAALLGTAPRLRHRFLPLLRGRRSVRPRGRARLARALRTRLDRDAPSPTAWPNRAATPAGHHPARTAHLRSQALAAVAGTATRRRRALRGGAARLVGGAARR